MRSMTSPEAKVDAIDSADYGPVLSVVPHVEPVAVPILESLPKPVRFCLYSTFSIPSPLNYSCTYYGLHQVYARVYKDYI